MSENKCGLSIISDYIVYESINEVYRAIKKKKVPCPLWATVAFARFYQLVLHMTIKSTVALKFHSNNYHLAPWNSSYRQKTFLISFLGNSELFKFDRIG